MPYDAKEKAAARQRAYRERRRLSGNPIRKTAANQRRYELRSRYGLTPEEYAALLAAQGGVCASCREACTKALAVDHDHATGKVRGLLCLRCNTALGLLREDPARIAALGAYLDSALKP